MLRFIHTGGKQKRKRKFSLMFVAVQAEGDTARTRSKFENELNENKVQFVRIRDKNVNFVLCLFQRCTYFCITI